MSSFSRARIKRSLIILLTVVVGALSASTAKSVEDLDRSQPLSNVCSHVSFDEAMAKGIRSSKSGERTLSSACFGRAFFLNKKNFGAALLDTQQNFYPKCRVTGSWHLFLCLVEVTGAKELTA